MVPILEEESSDIGNSIMYWCDKHEVFLFWSVNSEERLLSFYLNEMSSFCLSTNKMLSFTSCVYCADLLSVLEMNCGNKTNNDQIENNLTSLMPVIIGIKLI